MDSDSDSDMAAAPKRELQRNGLKGDKGPRWDGQKTTKDAWWYKFQPYLRTLGLWETANGANRNWRLDPDKVDKYETLNWKLWRAINRSIMEDTLAGNSLLMTMQDDFPAGGDQGDGYALVQWIDAYASDLTEREVTKLVEQVEKGYKFSISDTPAMWMHIGQQLKQTWDKIRVATGGPTSFSRRPSRFCQSDADPSFFFKRARHA